METLFDQYKELNINGSLICLEQVEDIYSYFCYPTNAKAIGFEGSIMYCFRQPCSWVSLWLSFYFSYGSALSAILMISSSAIVCGLYSRT